MTDRRANLTVDLDCPKCRGLGQRPRVLTVGFGPSAHEFTVSEPCKCLRVEREDPPQPVHAPASDEITITVNGRKFWTVPRDVIGYEHIVRLAGMAGTPTVTAIDPGGDIVEVGRWNDLALRDGTSITVKER